MLTVEMYESARLRALEYLGKAGIVVSEHERRSIQVAEYNMGDIDSIGLELVVYVNTERCCAKELILFPGQTCPEHRHPPVEGEQGKEETFRCRWGEVFLYIPESQEDEAVSVHSTMSEGGGHTGSATRSGARGGSRLHGKTPAGYEEYFTCSKEIVLKPGDQFTIPPDTLHWFRSGPEGAVVSEFSTRSRDEADVYTDPRISASQPRTV
jgi:D-lyxose ketol-isomerase